jgi:long-chain acyl-CoA synthetase
MKVRRGEVARRLASESAQRPVPKPEEKDLSVMSSLERVELLSELENKYRLELNEEEFSKLNSRQELDEWIRKAATVRADASEPVKGRPLSEWARAFPVRWFRRAFQRALVIPVSKYYLPLTVTGLEHLQDLQPPVIFAANHESHLDTAAMFAALPSRWRRRLAPAMAQDAFRAYFEPEQFPWKEVWWTGLGYLLACGLFNAYPLPQRMSGARRALNYTGDLVRRGYCPLVYPEGLRSPDGQLHSFRPGIGMMATRLRVPIVPVYIDGMYEIYSVRDSWPKPGPVRVSFGTPQEFTTETYEEVAQKLHRAVEVLSGIEVAEKV